MVRVLLFFGPDPDLAKPSVCDTCMCVHGSCAAAKLKMKVPFPCDVHVPHVTNCKFKHFVLDHKVVYRKIQMCCASVPFNTDQTNSIDSLASTMLVSHSTVRIRIALNDGTCGSFNKRLVLSVTSVTFVRSIATGLGVVVIR